MKRVKGLRKPDTKLDKATIQIRGMSCAACVRRVENGLQTLPGVSEATVNFATERASVTFDPSLVNRSQLEAKITDMGYEPFESPSNGPHKTIISIGGMTCAACVRRVENLLKGPTGYR